MVDEERDEEGQEEEEQETAPPPRTATRTRKHGANTPGVGSGNMNGGAAPGKRAPRMLADGTPNAKWDNREAELMWPEILDAIEAKGHSAYEVSIQVVRLSPAGADGAVPMGSIDGNSATGDKQVGPGDRLMQLITDQFHMPTQRGPARYEVRFVWKQGSGRIGTGILNLPSPAEIIALRNAAYSAANEREQQAQQPQLGAPQRQMPPQQAPQQYPQQPPWAPYYGAPMYPGYGMGFPNPPPYVPPAPGVHHEPGISPELSAMRMELAATRGALNEALAAAREGRQPRIEGVAQPQSEDAIAEKVTARVLMALQKAGVGFQPAQPATVAAPAAAAATTTDGLRGMVDQMISGVFQTAVTTMKSNFEKSVRQVMGVGAPPEEAAAEIAEPEVKDEFKTPFDVAPVSDVKWPDGSPVRYAADRSSGDISPMGLAFGNPYMVEKAMSVATNLTEALTDVLKGAAQKGLGAPQQRPQQSPQVVREIPRAASDATPTDDNTGNNSTPPTQI